MNIKRTAIVFGLAIFIIFLDQGTKQWALHNLTKKIERNAPPACNVDGPVEMREIYKGGRRHGKAIIPFVFELRYVENCGGAWGLMEKTSESFRLPFFIGVSLFAIVFIVWIMLRIGPKQKFLLWALPFVLGGAIGNFIDRIIYRYVIDFIDVYIRFLPFRVLNPWPTFNVADIAICVGVGLMILDMIPSRKRDLIQPTVENQTDGN